MYFILIENQETGKKRALCSERGEITKVFNLLMKNLLRNETIIKFEMVEE
jgi:hypothetical protein